nr:archaeosortase/exosortase family protein [Methylocucumis oryzae]
MASKKLSQSIAVFNAEAKPKHISLRFLLHFALFAGFWLLSSLLFNEKITLNPDTNNTLALLWLLIGSLNIISLLLANITFSAWRQFLLAEKLNLVIALLTGFITWGLSTLVSSSWSKLADITFYTSHVLLSLFYPNVTALPKEKALGIGDFQVEIGIPCSGYEGIGLIVIFLSIYLWLMRAELRFPQVLLLYPLGITLMWFFNVLRISLLIIIGKEWSPAVAIGGFHSNAGWIAFIALSIGMIGLAQRVTFF